MQNKSIEQTKEEISTDPLTTEIMVLRERIAKLEGKLLESKKLLGRLRRSISVHPDCEVGSEFDDYTTDAQNLEDEIESLINKVK